LPDKKIHPALIGSISAALMIAALLAGYYQAITKGEIAQLIAYGFYALGIGVTLLLHGGPQKGFGGNFSVGFRCFIVVTLIMVLFTYVFNSLHPETAQQAAALYRESLQQAKNRTPEEIEKEVKLFIEGFATMVVSRSIFGYLIFGSLVTAVGSVLQTIRKA
jgi:hypothetical protein